MRILFHSFNCYAFYFCLFCYKVWIQFSGPLGNLSVTCTDSIELFDK